MFVAEKQLELMLGWFDREIASYQQCISGAIGKYPDDLRDNFIIAQQVVEVGRAGMEKAIKDAIDKKKFGRVSLLDKDGHIPAGCICPFIKTCKFVEDRCPGGVGHEPGQTYDSSFFCPEAQTRDKHYLQLLDDE